VAFFFQDLGHQHAGARIIFNHHDQGHTGTLAALKKCIEGCRGTAAISTHRDIQTLDCHKRQSRHLTRMLRPPGLFDRQAHRGIHSHRSPRRHTAHTACSAGEQELKADARCCE
jgi:hypothetical protein